jgi:hypothetical protein
MSVQQWIDPSASLIETSELAPKRTSSPARSRRRQRVLSSQRESQEQGRFEEGTIRVNGRQVTVQRPSSRLLYFRRPVGFETRVPDGNARNPHEIRQGFGRVRTHRRRQNQSDDKLLGRREDDFAQSGALGCMIGKGRLGWSGSTSRAYLDIDDTGLVEAGCRPDL